MGQKTESYAETRRDLLAVLVSVFTDVLKQGKVEHDDDFFDLGGDSLTATALMAALDALGIQLPISVLFDAPTPVQLASMIESASSRHEAPLVTLKPGDARQIIFIAPGAGGSVLEMVPFARRIDTSRQVCGLQPRGRSGERLEFDTIEQASAFYLPLIRAAQPHGPYILAGYSMGGLVALELAHMLLAAGEDVGLLVILDTLTPIQHFPLGGKLHFWLRRGIHHAHVARGLRGRHVLPYAAARARAMLRDVRRRVSLGETVGWPQGQPSIGGSMPGSPLTSAAAIFLRYKPKLFPGPVAFLQSESVGGKTYYPDILWAYLAQSVAIYRVKGDHETMLRDHHGSVSAAFSSAVNKYELGLDITKT